jgi:hypothetical protein
MTMSLLLLLITAPLLPLTSQSAQAPQAKTPLDTVFKPVKWRFIGPFRGGRSVAGSGVVGDPKTYYMGTTGGGVWKTDNMGITWRNVSDGYFKTGSVGAIAVAESDPNVVYVGMGEHAVRGVMTHSGDGVYRSTDARRLPAAARYARNSGLDVEGHVRSSRTTWHHTLRSTTFSPRKTPKCIRGSPPLPWVVTAYT